MYQKHLRNSHKRCCQLDLTNVYQQSSNEIPLRFKSVSTGQKQQSEIHQNESVVNIYRKLFTEPKSNKQLDHIKRFTGASWLAHSASVRQLFFNIFSCGQTATANLHTHQLKISIKTFLQEAVSYLIFFGNHLQFGTFLTRQYDSMDFLRNQ